jgi:hypothetical protein
LSPLPMIVCSIWGHRLQSGLRVSTEQGAVSIGAFDPADSETFYPGVYSGPEAEPVARYLAANGAPEERGRAKALPIPRLAPVTIAILPRTAASLEIERSLYAYTFRC